MFDHKNKKPARPSNNPLKKLICKKVKDLEKTNCRPRQMVEGSTKSFATDMSVPSTGESMMMGVPVRKYQPEKFILSRSVLARIDAEVDDVANVAEEEIEAMIYSSFLSTQVDVPELVEKQEMTSDQSRDYVVQQVLKSLNCGNASVANSHQRHNRHVGRAPPPSRASSRLSKSSHDRPIPKTSSRLRGSPTSVLDFDIAGPVKTAKNNDQKPVGSSLAGGGQHLLRTLSESPRNPYGVHYPPALRKEESIINYSLRLGPVTSRPTTILHPDDERDPRPARNSPPTDDRIADRMLQNLRQRSISAPSPAAEHKKSPPASTSKSRLPPTTENRMSPHIVTSNNRKSPYIITSKPPPPENKKNPYIIASSKLPPTEKQKSHSVITSNKLPQHTKQEPATSVKRSSPLPSRTPTGRGFQNPFGASATTSIEVIPAPTLPFPQGRIRSDGSCSDDDDTLDSLETSASSEDDSNTDFYSEFSIDRSAGEAYYEEEEEDDDDETSYGGQSYGGISYGEASSLGGRLHEGMRNVTGVERLFDQLMCTAPDVDNWETY
jgi:hypothetical protein